MQYVPPAIIWDQVKGGDQVGSSASKASGRSVVCVKQFSNVSRDKKEGGFKNEGKGAEG